MHNVRLIHDACGLRLPPMRLLPGYSGDRSAYEVDAVLNILVRRDDGPARVGQVDGSGWLE